MPLTCKETIVALKHPALPSKFMALLHVTWSGATWSCLIDASMASATVLGGCAEPVRIKKAREKLEKVKNKVQERQIHIASMVAKRQGIVAKQQQSRR